MSQFGEWLYVCDRAATIEAYRQASAGGSTTCTCNGCRNFTAARGRAFPSEFLQLLSDLGIDPTKDAEVYHEAKHKPGFHFYGGWFHYIGSLEVAGDFAPVNFGNGFISYMSMAHAPRLDSFDDLEVVQLEFRADNIPWVLDENEPD